MKATSIAEMVPRLDGGLDSLERGDVDAFMSMIEETAHPDCEFTSVIGSAVGGSSYEGIDEIRAWFNDLVDTLDHLSYRDREYRVIGERAILFLAIFEIEGASSGAVVQTEIGTLFEYGDGLVQRATTHGSHADALAAAEALDA